MRFAALRILLLISLSACCISMQAQTWNDLQKNKSEWIIGHGYGSSSREADQNALKDVASQIRVKVSSEIMLKSGSTKSQVRNRIKETLTDSLESIISTYSSVTLNNCQRMIIENGPKRYHIVRYISIEDVNNVFQEREEKIKYMLKVAEQAERELKIDAALKNFYWAQRLINTLPSPSNVTYYDYEGNKQIISVWVPGKISSILDGLDFEFGGYTSEDHTLGKLLITYDGKPVSAVDYVYMDGISWSTMTSAKDGLGVLELRKDVDVPSISITVEYQYNNELHQDPEIENIIAIMDPVTFNEAYKTGIPLKEKGSSGKKRAQQIQGPEEDEAVYSFASIDTHETASYEESIHKILDAVSHKSSGDISGLFTPEGYDTYRKLLLYGNARVLDDSHLKFMKFNEEVYCRSVPMDFAFQTNDKHFVEDIVFIFDSTGKVSGLTFALEDKTVQDINAMTMWKDEHKIILIQFLESYKTAFALKNIDYLESIFSEDALIITGRVVQKTVIENQITLQKQYVEYNRQSKAEYMSNLRRSFNSKEYINLKFSNTTIGSWRDGLFGVSLKQDYYSSNYGDCGYLFLYVDLRDYRKPIIHVRTWQPEPNKDIDSLSGLYEPGNF